MACCNRYFGGLYWDRKCIHCFFFISWHSKLNFISTLDGVYRFPSHKCQIYLASPPKTQVVSVSMDAEAVRTKWCASQYFYIYFKHVLLMWEKWHTHVKAFELCLRLIFFRLDRIVCSASFSISEWHASQLSTSQLNIPDLECCERALVWLARATSHTERDKMNIKICARRVMHIYMLHVLSTFCIDDSEARQ